MPKIRTRERLHTATKYYWVSILPLKVLNHIEERYGGLGPENIGDWMIKERSHSSSEGRCFRPFARCWVTEKSLFLRKCVKVEVRIKGPGSDVVEHFYFDPKRYTLYLMED